MFAGFLSLRPECEVCGLDYNFIDSGDGPAVFVILIAGFLVVGAALIVETAARLRAEGWRELRLDVNVNNPVAMGLYRRLGFELVRRYVSYQKELPRREDRHG